MTLTSVEREYEMRLIEATWTLHCLPDPDSKFRRGFRTSLPDHVRDKLESYGWESSEKNRYIPSPQEISRYQETLDWLDIVIPKEKEFMFYAFLAQRGERVYRIPWKRVRHLTNVRWSSRWCLEVYKSWVRTIAHRSKL